MVDVLAERHSARLAAHRRTRCDVADVRVGALPGTRVVLARPRSFMNTSGGPVVALVDYFDVPLDQLVVVHDELDLPFEGLRLKRGGGDNGHNGLRSVRQALGTGEFLRVRVGIGRPPGRMNPADFVLRPYAAEERKHLPLVVDTAADAAETLVQHGLERAQNDFNS